MKEMMQAYRSHLPGLLLGLAAVLVVVLITGCGGVPEEEVQRREAVAAGRASFRAYCTGCHGPEARGNGPAAPSMAVAPADLTTIAQRNDGTFQADRIFERIDGYSRVDSTASLQMLQFGDIWRGVNPTAAVHMEVEQRIEEIVAYLETIQR